LQEGFIAGLSGEDRDWAGSDPIEFLEGVGYDSDPSIPSIRRNRAARGLRAYRPSEYPVFEEGIPDRSIGPAWLRLGKGKARAKGQSEPFKNCFKRVKCEMCRLILRETCRMGRDDWRGAIVCSTCGKVVRKAKLPPLDMPTCDPERIGNFTAF
jgi:hypothetical protein